MCVLWDDRFERVNMYHSIIVAILFEQMHVLSQLIFWWHTGTYLKNKGETI